MFSCYEEVESSVGVTGIFEPGQGHAQVWPIRPQALSVQINPSWSLPYNAHVQSAAAQDVDRGSWQGPPLDCNIWFVGPARPRPVCPWPTVAPPADGHLTASLGGRQSFFGAPVCRSGARTRADVLSLRGPRSSGIGSAAVGKKMEGRKMGTSSRERREQSHFCRPGFLFFQFRVLKFRTFQRPRMSADERPCSIGGGPRR